MSAERVHWRVVLPAAVLQAIALTLGSFGYGYHRDELYFRMLPPAWGYLDQPPLMPLLARLTTHLADEPWALRLPATTATALSVVVVALICRELGGRRGAQALAAWGYAFAAMPLMLGHILLTSTVDLLLLALLVLTVLRATSGSPRWWLAAGLVAGLATSNRLVVVVVGVGLLLGIAVLGPRRSFRSPTAWGGAVVAVVVGLPTLLYQATHGGRSSRWARLCRTTTPARSTPSAAWCSSSCSAHRWSGVGYRASGGPARRASQAASALS